MSVPVLKQGDALIATLQADTSDRDLIGLQESLANAVGRYRSTAIVIDVSALEVMDSFATRTLQGLARVTRLRGARTVVVGIQPDVAFAMTQLGLTLEEVATAFDLESGLAVLDEMSARGGA